MDDDAAPAEEQTSTEAPQDAGPLDSPAVRYRWLGDAGRWFDGVPNRDITDSDTHLSPELLAAAVEAGTHEAVN